MLEFILYPISDLTELGFVTGHGWYQTQVQLLDGQYSRNKCWWKGKVALLRSLGTWDDGGQMS